MKTNRQRFTRILASLPLLCVGLAYSAAGFASGTSPDDLPSVTLRFGDNAPANSPSGHAAEKLASIVKEKSHGKLTIKVYPANQLGNNRDLVEQTSLGGLDMSMEGIGILGYIDPIYNLLQVPFLFRSQAHIHKVLEGPLGNKMAKDILQKRHIMLLSQIWDRLPRQICSKKPIQSPKDLSDVLIRTGSKGATQAFSLFNAKPSSIPMSGVYLALQNNVVSSVDLPTDYIYNMSLYEVCKNLDLVNHTYGTQFVAINRMVYAGLPAQYQKILTESVKEAGDFNNQLVQDAGSGYVKKLEAKGMNIVRLTPEQHEAFAEVIHKNIKKIESTWPGTQGMGQKILDTK